MKTSPLASLPSVKSRLRVRHWMFGVGCSMFAFLFTLPKRLLPGFGRCHRRRRPCRHHCGEAVTPFTFHASRITQIWQAMKASDEQLITKCLDCSDFLACLGPAHCPPALQSFPCTGSGGGPQPFAPMVPSFSFLCAVPQSTMGRASRFSCLFAPFCGHSTCSHHFVTNHFVSLSAFNSHPC